jgi:hypothetical protein
MVLCSGMVMGSGIFIANVMIGSGIADVMIGSGIVLGS